MDTAQKTSRIALAATALSAAAWTAKALAIGLAGGLQLSPAEGPLFVLGALAYLVAVLFLIRTWTHRLRPRTRALAALGAIPLGVGLAAATRLAVAAIEPPSPHWVWAEVNLWFIAAAVLVAAAVTARRRGSAPGQASPGWGVPVSTMTD